MQQYWRQSNVTGVLCGIFLPTTNVFLEVNTPNSHGLIHDMRHKKYVLCFNRKTCLIKCSLGSKVNEGFFLHTLDQDISYVCPIQKAIQKSMSKPKQGEYLYHWRKAVDILKHDKHLLFGGFESWHGNNIEKIDYIYKRLMLLIKTLSKMSLFHLCANVCIGGYHVKRLKMIPNDLGKNCRKARRNICCEGEKMPKML